MNAVKHGLAAAEIVVLDEDPAEFEALRADVKAYFESKGLFEQHLVDRVAGLLWRLRRIPLLEAALIRDEVEKVEASEPPGGRAVEELFARLDKIRTRMQSAVDDDAGTDDREVARADDDEAASLDEDEAPHADPEEAVSEKEDPPEARHRRIDRALALLASKNTIGNLSRYEASLMTALSRTVALLHLCQSLRIQPNHSEHLRINFAPPSRSRTTNSSR
jgi:hypothetical protein